MAGNPLHLSGDHHLAYAEEASFCHGFLPLTIALFLTPRRQLPLPSPRSVYKGIKRKHGERGFLFRRVNIIVLS